MNDIENYYNQFNMCSYEYPTEDKRKLSRLYNLKLKLTKKEKSEKEN